MRVTMKPIVRDSLLIICTVFLVLTMMLVIGVFDRQLSEHSYERLTKSLIRDKTFRERIVSEMQGRGTFVGPIGQQGPRGPKGDSVPVGTVLPFIGQGSQLPPGWRVANEEELTAFLMNHNDDTEANTMAAQVASKLRRLAGEIGASSRTLPSSPATSLPASGKAKSEQNAAPTFQQPRASNATEQPTNNNPVRWIIHVE